MPSHLIADEVAAAGFRVARVWHTSAGLERAPTPGVLFAVVVVDGDADVSFGGATHAITSGDLVVSPEGGPLSLTAVDRIARFEFELTADGSALSPAAADALRSGAVIADAAPSFRPVLLAAVNAAFNAGLDPDAAGFPSFRLATISLLVGLLDAALGPRILGRSSGEALLYRRALDAIALNAGDPSFSVTALARALAVSDRHLRRIFHGRGSSPGTALCDARLARARALLGAATPLPPGEAARLAGFRSARALRRAAARRAA
ncbi:helix-turn-helix domain-containing protein [Rathayibacter sp. SD072]|uniref:helix-turn-helix domain-containing protein n=1 Tax=Rathayibacter sp. SD072 TaxID=2781731 RepID=UPI001A96BFE2|nr:helix-turn-helix domain-containing protein [Rathayibacter sp. SD072]MBO0984081.1 helix-turn-helix domain-containing protein [Rathayibacter sp. SD072]